MRAILVNIRSVHNVGSIFRTADAVGAEKLYLCGITPGPHDRFGNVRPDFAKVALGADVPWEVVRSAARVMTALKKDGWTIVAIEQAKTAVPYAALRKVLKNDKVCLVMGNEVTGIPTPLLKRANIVAEIPMRGSILKDPSHPRHVGRGKESLNVGVAFGVVAFGLLAG